MTTLELYMILLMVIALLIGFSIGWILRRQTYRKGYKEKFYKLVNSDKIALEELNRASFNFENSEKQLFQIKDKNSSKENFISDLTDQSSRLKIDCENLNLVQKKLQENFNSIDEKIKIASNELNVLTLNRDEILEQKDQIRDYAQKTTDKNREIETLSQQIPQLIDERASLETKITNLKKGIDEMEEEIKIENKKTKEIEDEFDTKKSEIFNDIKETKQKALNYEYAFKYINEKVDAGEKVAFDVVDKIINKNEEKGFFANLKQKLFSASAKYIKQGR